MNIISDFEFVFGFLFEYISILLFGFWYHFWDQIHCSHPPPPYCFYQLFCKCKCCFILVVMAPVFYYHSLCSQNQMICVWGDIYSLIWYYVRAINNSVLNGDTDTWSIFCWCIWWYYCQGFSWQSWCYVTIMTFSISTCPPFLRALSFEVTVKRAQKFINIFFTILKIVYPSTQFTLLIVYRAGFFFFKYLQWLLKMRTRFVYLFFVFY